MHSGGLRAADAITWLRLLMLPVIWWFALLGQSRIVGAGLLFAGLTDFLDGFVARRFGGESPSGAARDVIADTLLFVSAAAWIGMLRPELVRENTQLVVGVVTVYLAAMAAGFLRFRRLPNLRLYSSKVAGGLLYGFAVVTLMSGRYDRLLLAAAAGALVLSSAETLVGQLLFSEGDAEMGSVFLVRRRRADTSTSQVIDRASRQRSQAPTANVAGSIANPINSIAIDDAPNAKDSGA